MITFSEANFFLSEYIYIMSYLSKQKNAINKTTKNLTVWIYPFSFRKAWFAIDLGVWLIPTSYTLRHARGYGKWVRIMLALFSIIWYM